MKDFIEAVRKDEIKYFPPLDPKKMQKIHFI